MIYLCGDTHGNYEIHKLLNEKFISSKEFSKDDYFIILGDFGVFWKDETDEAEKNILEAISKLPFTVLFIDGNHENFNRLFSFKNESKFKGTVGVCGENLYWLKRGEIYEICGKNIFVFGGALSIDKAHRTPNLSWWKQEMPSEDEKEYAIKNIKNFMKNGKSIDIVLSHTAPNSAISRLGYRINSSKIDSTSIFLEHIFFLAKPKEWYFGHFHNDVEFDLDGCKFRLCYDNIVEISNIK
ncbi:metallophosphoesterase family protein [Campylobacter geochelonis]|uniref:metallophosphoesterase family protein n=1 Tax=Campylobacter geochelonis TaxID=1780362 RepID=UPI0007709DAB|nr:metallophosphoesterase [Campylobacter geochelonis]CZE48340.1 Uncharacterised protein [Campylobacter geochelonis]